MSSDLEIVPPPAADLGGRKPGGPVTPEGRARSAHNSLRHGLTAKSVVLPHESRAEFRLLVESYVAQFAPSGGVEMELVEAMAAARWRLRRLCAIETTLLTNEMIRRHEEVEDVFTQVVDADRLAWSFQKMADHGGSLSLLMRYETSLTRVYDRAFRQLQILQAARKPFLPNEPAPGSRRAPSAPAGRNLPAAPNATTSATPDTASPASEVGPSRAGKPGPRLVWRSASPRATHSLMVVGSASPATHPPHPSWADDAAAAVLRVLP